jgi:hypothetical protein
MASSPRVTGAKTSSWRTSSCATRGQQPPGLGSSMRGRWLLTRWPGTGGDPRRRTSASSEGARLPIPSRPRVDTPARGRVAGPGGRADRAEHHPCNPSHDRTDEVRGVRRCGVGDEVARPQRGRRADHRRRYRGPIRARPDAVPTLAPEARDGLGGRTRGAEATYAESCP